jgi:hypothetical protein
MADVSLGFGINLLSEVPFQQLRIDRDSAQRLAEIVAGGVGELLQIVIGSAERMIGVSEGLVGQLDAFTFAGNQREEPGIIDGQGHAMRQFFSYGNVFRSIASP